MRRGGTGGLLGRGGPIAGRGGPKGGMGLLGLDQVVSELVILLFLGSGVNVEGGRTYF